MPAQVHIGPLSYDVKADTLSHLLAEHEAERRVYGTTNHKTMTIVVSPEVAPMQARSTLIHEAMHALIYAAGFEITDDDEERLIRVLEVPLLAFIRENPDLIAWVTSDSV
jgi:hypothetical protein